MPHFGCSAAPPCLLGEWGLRGRKPTRKIIGIRARGRGGALDKQAAAASIRRPLFRPQRRKAGTRGGALAGGEARSPYPAPGSRAPQGTLRLQARAAGAGAQSRNCLAGEATDFCLFFSSFKYFSVLLLNKHVEDQLP